MFSVKKANYLVVFGGVLTLVSFLLCMILIPYYRVSPLLKKVRDLGGTVGTRSIVQPIFVPSAHTIDKIDFRDTALEDSDLALLKSDLSKLPHLKYLILSNTNVTDAGLANIEDLETLEYIYLDGTGVTEHGVEFLREHLPNARTIDR